MPPPKIHPALAAVLESRVGVMDAAGATQPEIKIIVKHKPLLQTMAAAAAIGGVVAMGRQYTRVFNGSSMAATPQAIRELANRPDIDEIWLDEEIHTLLDESVPLIAAPTLWSNGLTGKGIKVGIVDTGIDPDHPDFAGRISTIKDFTGEGEPDNNGHGTHVAGIVGGTGAQSSGKYRGVAPDCTYVIAKVLRGNGSGMMSDAIAGLEFMLEQQVHVVNMSLGGDTNCDGTDALSTACDNLWDQGIVVCVAAGNAGPGEGTLGSPGCAKKPITVGATDKQDKIAYYSSHGPTLDGRAKPDVCFPGSDIHSCRAKNTTMGQPIDAFYTTASGTSMATPHASGTCALLLQGHPGAKPQDIKDALMSTAKNLGLEANTQGKGRADVVAASQALGAAPQPPTPPPAEPPAQPVTPTPQTEDQNVPKPAPAPAPPGGGCRDLIRALISG